jgi:hypothetical protein
MSAQPAVSQPDRPDAFISYAREDIEFARDVCKVLEGQGKAVWIDLRNIPPTADWRAEVDEGVQAASAFVFLLSPDSVASPICGEELARAVGLNKRLVPVLRRDVDPARVPSDLARLNWIPLREADDRGPGLALLVEALDTDLAWRDAHARLAVRAHEWLRHDRDASYLLRGSDLRVAEAWLAEQGDHAEGATADQTAYVIAGRQAATRRRGITLAAVAGALVVTALLAVLALLAQQRAVEREKLARSRELAARLG